MPFQDVNAGLYNQMVTGLGQSQGSFVLLQPCNPVLDNNALWNHYFNLIPPVSYVFNNVLSSGSQFFDNYSALNSALQSAGEKTYETKVPQAIRDEFDDFIMNRATIPSLSQYPALFRNWAFLKHPSIANTGASALAAAILDPITAAQLRLMPYQGDPAAEPPIAARQPDWDENFTQLKTQLASGVARSFNYSQSTANTNVSSSWSHGQSSGFFGLWGSSSSSSSQSVTFSKSDFSVVASFKHVISFSPVPGPWFSSAALSIALNNKNKAPWLPGNPVTWDTAFNPATGNLARFIVNLVVVDTMNVTVRSQAIFSHDDQTVISNNSGGGLWPFYTSSGNSGAATHFSFDNQGHMTVTISSLPGVPIVLGANVLPVQQFAT
jgi:hypothetical protein